MLRVRLLGHLRIEGTSPGATLHFRPRAQRLVAYLLLQRGAPRPRDHVAFTLWPDTPEREALGVLRRALNDARGALPALPQGEWIIAGQGGMRWNSDAPTWLDVTEFERLAEAATPTAWHQAADLYGADLLVDWDEEWLRIDRERLRRLQQDTLRHLVAHHRGLGEFEMALRCARLAASRDPLAETVARDLMALIYESGDRSAALAEYQRLRAVLQHDLGVAPMAETQALAAAIAEGRALPPLETGGVGPARAAGPLPPRPIGREQEWAHLTHLWAFAAGGQGRLAIVSGEGGIGKTHLAMSLARHATAQGGLALRGHSYQFEHALPYQAIVEMLRSGASAFRYAALSPAHRSTLARLVPDLLGTAAPPAAAEGLTAELRPHLFEALLQTFLGMARSQPLLLQFEDVHWAAASTLDWLTYIAPRLSAHPVLVVITYRTDEVGAEHALGRLERRLAREGLVSLLKLGPLTREAHRELVRRLSSLAPAQADPIADRLYEDSGGNPFYLHEIIRELIERGQIAIAQEQWTGVFVQGEHRAEIPLPQSIVETISGRVERLNEMSQMFLTTAAVAGRVFEFEIVRRAGGWADEHALQAVEDLLAREFLREGDSRGGLAFVHHLVQEGIYARLVAPRRVFWHRRLAEAIQALRPDDLGALAHHNAAAGDDAQAAAFFIEAAERAAAVQAFADALGALEAASTALEHRRDAGAKSGQDLRQEIDLLLRRAFLVQLVGRSVEEQRSVLESAAGLLATHLDQPLQATLYLRQSQLFARCTQYPKASEAAMTAYDLYRALNDHRGAGHALVQAGRMKVTVSENRAGRRYLEKGLALYRLADDEASQSWCLTLLAWAGMNLGDVDEALAHLDRALQLSEGQGDRLGVARACSTLAAAWNYYLDAARVDAFAQRAIALYRELALPSARVRPLLFLGAAHYLRGELAQAAETYVQVLGESVVYRDSWPEGWASQMLGRLALGRGDLAQGEQYLERAFRLREASGELSNQVSDLTWLGRLRLAQGRTSDALSTTREALRRLESLWGEFYVWQMPDVFLAHAETLSANGEEGAAVSFIHRAYDTLMAFAAQIGDGQVKADFLASPFNARVLTAWREGRALPLVSEPIGR